MGSKRTIILMGILLAMLLGYLGLPWVQRLAVFQPPVEKPLPGNNSVSAINLSRNDKGSWIASFDYFYTGAPEFAQLRIRQVDSTDGTAQTAVPAERWVGLAKRGKHHVDVTLYRPQADAVKFTKELSAQMTSPGGSAVLVSMKTPVDIQWTSHESIAMEQALAGMTPEQMLASAVNLIDNGSEKAMAKANILLDRVIDKNPQMDGAYIEMARIRLKVTGGGEGLRQAESLLDSAIRIRDSANARILQAHVYAHQKKFKESEALLVEAAKSEPRNLWLWANWGDLLILQGRTAPAIAKYREAVARPVTNDTYDRAREYAYNRAIPLLEAAKDFDAAEALHKQRAQDYGYGPCSGPAHAVFLLRHRGDAAGALEVAKKAGESHCPLNNLCEVIGAANYLAWSSAVEPQKTELLNKARAYFPAGPRLFYQLGSSDRLVTVGKQLIAAGESVDQQDNYKLTALAYALRQSDLDTARRLMRLGAKPDALVGLEQMPAALVPVLARDIEGVRLMQRSGVDYSKLRFQGQTAIDHARQAGDKQMQSVLEAKAGAI